MKLPILAIVFLFASMLAIADDDEYEASPDYSQMLDLSAQVKGAVALAFSPDARALACGCDDGRLFIYSLPDNLGKTVYQTDKSISAVSFSRDGKLLAVGSREGKVQVLTSPGYMPSTVIHTKGVPSSIAFSTDSGLFATGSDKGQVSIWSTKTGVLVRELSGHKKRVLLTAFEGAQNVLLTVGADKSLREWNSGTGQMIRSVEWPKISEVRSAACADDCRTLAVGVVEIRYTRGYSGIREFPYFLVLNREGQEIRRIGVGNANQVGLASISYDGRLLATGAFSDCVRVYDVESGGEVAKFQGFKSPLCVTFSRLHDRLWFATASSERIGGCPIGFPRRIGEPVGIAAVLPLGWKDGVSRDAANAAFDILRGDLSDLSPYRFVTRDKVNDIIAEQRIQNTALVDQETRVKIGRLLGARYLFAGQCTKAGSEYVMSVDRVDVETGEMKSYYSHAPAADESVLISLAQQTVSKICKE